jgi:hypothetical protein
LHFGPWFWISSIKSLFLNWPSNFNIYAIKPII